MSSRLRALTLPALLLGSFALSSCGTDAGAEVGSASGSGEASAAEQLLNLRAGIEALQAKPEVEADRIQVIHVLIGYSGAPRMNISRSAEDAEILAARVYDLAKNGESMTTLKREFSEDSGNGNYGMVMNGGGNSGDTPRNQMVPAFGNTGWRLEVGEIGVAPLHPTDSPFGWHIIQRTE